MERKQDDSYENMDINRTIVTFNNENLFECAIGCLEWLINENILKQESLNKNNCRLRDIKCVVFVD